MSRSPIDHAFGALVFLASPPPPPPFDRCAVGHRDVAASETLPDDALLASFSALKPDLVLTSDQKRQSPAACRVADACGTTLVMDRRLRDRHFGDYEGMSYTELALHGPESVAFLESFATAAPPSGETLAEVGERATQAIQEVLLKRHRGTLAVVAECGVIRSVLATSLGLPQAVTCRWRLDPLSTSGLRLEGTMATLAWLNRFGGGLYF